MFPTLSSTAIHGGLCAFAVKHFLAIVNPFWEAGRDKGGRSHV
jgi:hypothetical protein